MSRPTRLGFHVWPRPRATGGTVRSAHAARSGVFRAALAYLVDEVGACRSIAGVDAGRGRGRR